LGAPTQKISVVKIGSPAAKTNPIPCEAGQRGVGRS
jgi:hypothetical protein